MKMNVIAVSALLVALASPLSAQAQQAPPPPAQAQNHATPTEGKLQHRWMKRLGNLNLSGDQQQRIQSMIDQYSQAHPQGSPRDQQATRDLRKQILGVLTPDQQSQYRQQMQQRRAQMAQRQGQPGAYQGQQQYQGQPGPYQGQPGQQYQGQQYQGPPPNQGPPNEGPPNEGPPNQGPPDQGPPNQGPPEQQPPA
jgi:Spy/CpxP family protein refolding chaperone